MSWVLILLFPQCVLNYVINLLSLPSPCLFIWHLGAGGQTWPVETQECGPWVQNFSFRVAGICLHFWQPYFIVIIIVVVNSSQYCRLSWWQKNLLPLNPYIEIFVSVAYKKLISNSYLFFPHCWESSAVTLETRKCPNSLFQWHLFFLSFCFWWQWGLNSGPHAC
jgi:hypothetical protein